MYKIFNDLLLSCYNIAMENQAIVVMGKSGSGKGTQVELISRVLRERGADVYEIEMGESFRNFLRESNYTAEKANNIAQEGGLQPDFLANYFLAAELIKYHNGKRNFIFDGTPRTKRQARVLDGALRFYQVENPIVLYLDVEDKVVLDRMQERGRSDDDINIIRNRLEWFEKETIRALEFFKTNSDYYTVHIIDGMKSIEEVEESIRKAISL
ncbi:MAG: nucleoside monophosphate kinase [Patescibacteria group bacterium]